MSLIHDARPAGRRALVVRPDSDGDVLLAGPAVRAVARHAAVILTSFHQSPLPTAQLARLAGIGFVASTSEDYPGSLLDLRHRFAVGDDRHEVEVDVLPVVNGLGSNCWATWGGRAG